MIAAVYKFTGKERDSESGLDNFGARYNASRRVAHPPDARLLWVPQPSRFSKAGSREFQINSGAESGSPAAAQVRKSSARADHTFLFARKSFKT